MGQQVPGIRGALLRPSGQAPRRRRRPRVAGLCTHRCMQTRPSRAWPQARPLLVDVAAGARRSCPISPRAAPATPDRRSRRRRCARRCGPRWASRSLSRALAGHAGGGAGARRRRRGRPAAQPRRRRRRADERRRDRLDAGARRPRRGDRDRGLVPAQRGLGQGPALRRRRRGGRRAAGVDARRARPGARRRAGAQRPARPDRAPARRRSLARATSATTARDAGTGFAARRAAPSCRPRSPRSSSATTSSSSTSRWSRRSSRWSPRRASPGSAAGHRRSRATASRSASSSSGTGERWFTGPRRLPIPARLLAGYAPEDMKPDLGDSAIVEVYGLGAPRRRGVARVGAVGRARPGGRARRSSRGCGAIAAAEHPAALRPLPERCRRSSAWTRARSCASASCRPIHTGIAHRRPGVGQIGGGVTHPPHARPSTRPWRAWTRRR